MNEKDVPLLYGWICHMCGRVMSPSMLYCVFCKGQNDTYEQEHTGGYVSEEDRYW